MISGWGVDQNRGTDFENSVIKPCSTGKNSKTAKRQKILER